MKIRKAKIDDLNRIIQITKSAYSRPYKEDGFVTKVKECKNFKNDFLDKKVFAIVAEHEGRIVGVVRYRINDNEIYFYRLAVLKSFRKQGIASRLIQEIEKIAKRNKIKIIKLDCAKEKELPAFYKKFGYKIDKTKKHLDHHDVFMSKKLIQS